MGMTEMEGTYKKFEIEIQNYGMKPLDLLCNLSSQSSSDKISTGCSVMDVFLHGGIPLKSITEIVGESGSGKTQLALQMLVSSVQSGDCHSLYLHTEFPVPLRRLHQIAASAKIANNNDPLDSILLHPLHSVESLMDLMPRLSSAITKLKIKLIVIDSVAAIFRREYGCTPTELSRRAAIFFKLSTKLRFLASKHEVAVLVTNQVVDTFDTNAIITRVGNAATLWSSRRKVSAALGLSWANCVNTRLFLGRDGKRYIRVLFAPHLPDSRCEFAVTRCGVFGVE